MIVSKYSEIDGKMYVEASDYDRILYKLKNSNEEISKLESELESKGSEIERLKKRIGKLSSIRVRCHESARDSFDLGNYGCLHIVTADELKTTKDKNDRTVELPFDALETANILINAEYSRQTSSVEKAFTGCNVAKGHIYSVDDLEQIAEHLLVYCKHNRED